MNARQLFQQHLAPTSPAPLALHITHAEGHTLTDADGQQYIDLIGGISVCHIGHRHPRVVAAIKAQADAYLHTMVYGELVQTPQVAYAERLAAHLPAGLDSVYFTNSGAEAVEGALKLAKRNTGRAGIVAAHHSYHGSTTGALALLGDEYWRNAFRPLMPGVQHHTYGSQELIEAITSDAACVVLETVQAEAGIIAPPAGWLQAVRHRCNETGTLLVLDEIQCGFGRPGSLWAFEQAGIVPDVLLLGKALGGGMPLGAFIASGPLMARLSANPVLGHISTFGGHPVSCAAGLAGFEALLDESMTASVQSKASLFESLLIHPAIKSIRSAGLLMAVELDSSDAALRAIQHCLAHGVFTDWFLFAPHCIRIAPPLNISYDAIHEACAVLCNALDA